MNCKPGDLAVVVRARDPKLLHRTVTGLEVAPLGIGFRLPDGYWHDPVFNDGRHRWLCEFSNPVTAPIGGGKTRQTIFAPVPDECLRPIRDPGDDAQDETLSWLPVPSREGVEA